MQNPDDLSESAYTVRFPREMLDQVRAWAASDRRSINQEIVWIVEQYVRERQHHEQAEEGKGQ